HRSVVSDWSSGVCSPEPSGLAEALQATRESLAALARMQDQPAQLHRQFLDGQEAAHRTVHLLVEQQQRLLQATLGLPLPAAPPQIGRASGRERRRVWGGV